eukprot:CAMPEP_0194031844 /NCGR_PEP_ID=MMETSP0009_2-20130614/4916_1 /TAXON_ID=210454 /ORGANISM="Grammatophora oceanica, Strain CCMP 410" /LENGTH=756 /DNA_ID=CAMNT_0038672091 /DNA_START=101 /DNA_END=2371 /DNA_ORIENTATION=-
MMQSAIPNKGIEPISIGRDVLERQLSPSSVEQFHDEQVKDQDCNHGFGCMDSQSLLSLEEQTVVASGSTKYTTTPVVSRHMIDDVENPSDVVGERSSFRGLRSGYVGVSFRSEEDLEATTLETMPLRPPKRASFQLTTSPDQNSLGFRARSLALSQTSSFSNGCELQHENCNLAPAADNGEESSDHPRAADIHVSHGCLVSGGAGAFHDVSLKDGSILCSSRRNHSNKRPSWWLRTCSAVFLLFLAVASLTIALTRHRKQGNSPSTDSETANQHTPSSVPVLPPDVLPPELHPRDLLFFKLQHESPDSGEALRSESSSRHKAFQFLIEREDGEELYNHESVELLYVLVLLHYVSAEQDMPRIFPDLETNDAYRTGDWCQWRGVWCRGKDVDLSFPNHAVVSTIPPELCMVSNLKSVDLRLNHMLGSLPPDMTKCSKLESLHLEYNELMFDLHDQTGLFLHATSLRELNLAHNSIQGSFPTEVGRLGLLQRLVMNNNVVTGSLPDQFWNLTMLRNLQLQHNVLTGSLSPSISRLSNYLVELDLGDNELQGSIPRELAFLELGQLDLYDNIFISTIPRALGAIDSLYSLDLSGNELTGTIPEDLTLLPNIHLWFSIGNNMLTGTLPTGFGRFTKLYDTFDVMGNYLTGTIPSFLGNLISLRMAFQLGSNRFDGSIPSELGRLSTVTAFSIGNNPSLSGLIPSELGNLLVVEDLDFRGTNVEGGVPTQVCDLLQDGRATYVAVGCDVLAGCDCCIDECV